MGAKTCMLVYSNGNAADSLKQCRDIDREKTVELVQQLFPHEKLVSSADGDLSQTSSPDNMIYAGKFADVFVLAAREFGKDHPAKLDKRFVNFEFGNTIHLHAMHSVVDWFAFGVWENGNLARSLSLSPDSGIMENLGQKLPFETPYWQGEHPAVDTEEEEEDYPFPFHPLELGEAALKAFYGYVLEGVVDPSLIEPESYPLMGFKRTNAWWKFWK